ncbi:MAG: SDR family NAD(P)-dependent oxidoreductase, partial [Pseudomonadota bacterium]
MIAPLTDLEGRRVLITGASSGLGAQFARDMAGAGAAVALCARRTSRLTSLKAEIEKAGGRAHAIEMDVDNEGSVIRAFDAAEAVFGEIDG